MSSTSNRRKTRKSVSIGKEEHEVDRISQLPDALIYYILSFIDTKYAVQTSFLSKRWVTIWKSLPFLNFDMYGYTLDKLNDLIDRVFMGRNKDSNIQSFRLRWCYYNTSGSGISMSVRRWIDGAVAYNVQEVTLELRQLRQGGTSDKIYPRQSPLHFTYKIPPMLVNCKTLKKLTLMSYDGFIDIILPKRMSLPQLKSMRLGGILVADVETSNQLFSSCPLLETLDIVNCDIRTDNQGNCTVESLSLKKFAYTNCHDQPSNVQTGHRLHGLMVNLSSIDSYLRRQLKPKIIKLSAPNLISFTCDYGDENEQQSTVEKEVYAIGMVKLLVAADKVERLDLSPGFLEVLSRATGLLNCQLKCLCNLQYLRLETKFTGGSLRTIAYLLTISPNLKTLILMLNGQNLVDAGDDWEVGFSMPGMLSHLSTVRIEEIEGCDAELKILSFLFKNAKVLKEVSLIFRSSVGSPDRVGHVPQFAGDNVRMICRQQLIDRLRQAIQFGDDVGALPRASPSVVSPSVGSSADRLRQVRRFGDNVRALPTASSKIKIILS